MSKPLERDLARIAAKRARAAAEVAELDRQLAVLQRAQAELIEAVVEETRLHGDRNRSNMRSNMQAETTGKLRRTRISAGRAEKDTPSRRAAIAADLTDLMIADITGAGRSTVQAWHSGARAVPRQHAEKLAKRGIPVSSWAKVQN